jgi:dipeptidase E
MRLYLSSFRTGDHPEHLLRLVHRPGRAVVVANAMDGAPPDVRTAAVQLEVDSLARLGLDAAELDLREYDDPAVLAPTLQEIEVLWVRGGNVFTLRHAMRSSALDALLPALLAQDALVYAGYSAGPCVLAPSLRGLEHCDDADEVRRLYDAEPVFDGLGVLDFALVPHVDSDGHPESQLLGEVARRYAATGVPHRTLRDGQALVVDGERTELV